MAALKQNHKQTLNLSTSLCLQADSSYAPTVLSGKAPGGRFGTAMAAAGDLNKDMYEDVIIGAPYVDGNRGAIYVFHGSRNGIDPTSKQVSKCFCCVIINFIASLTMRRNFFIIILNLVALSSSYYAKMIKALQ